MKLTKNSVKFMGILLFVLKYMYVSLLLKMINGFSWPAKIMASPFKSNENIFSLVLNNLQCEDFLYSIELRPALSATPLFKIGACLHLNSSLFAKNSTFYLKIPHLWGPTNVSFLDLLERRQNKFVNFERRIWKRLIDSHK